MRFFVFPNWKFVFCGLESRRLGRMRFVADLELLWKESVRYVRRRIVAVMSQLMGLGIVEKSKLGTENDLSFYKQLKFCLD